MDEQSYLKVSETHSQADVFGLLSVLDTGYHYQNIVSQSISALEKELCFDQRAFSLPRRMICWTQTLPFETFTICLPCSSSIRLTNLHWAFIRHREVKLFHLHRHPSNTYKDMIYIHHINLSTSSQFTS